jgi:hypothetical protein
MLKVNGEVSFKGRATPNSIQHYQIVAIGKNVEGIGHDLIREFLKRFIAKTVCTACSKTSYRIDPLNIYTMTQVKQKGI